MYRAGSSRVTHPFAGFHEVQAPRFVPRLACVRPAASVHPEPGSNSPLSDLVDTDVSTIDTNGGFEDRAVPRARGSGSSTIVIPHDPFFVTWGSTLTRRSLPTAVGRDRRGRVTPRPRPRGRGPDASLAFGTLCSSQGAMAQRAAGSVHPERTARSGPASAALRSARSRDRRGSPSYQLRSEPPTRGPWAGRTTIGARSGLLKSRGR